MARQKRHLKEPKKFRQKFGRVNHHDNDHHSSSPVQASVSDISLSGLLGDDDEKSSGHRTPPKSEMDVSTTREARPRPTRPRAARGERTRHFTDKNLKDANSNVIMHSMAHRVIIGRQAPNIRRASVERRRAANIVSPTFGVATAHSPNVPRKALNMWPSGNCIISSLSALHVTVIMTTSQ